MKHTPMKVLKGVCKSCQGDVMANYKHHPSMGKCLKCHKVAFYHCPPHYWLIESPDGVESEGVCKLCGAKREFRNSLEKEPRLMIKGSRNIELY